jgi:hypothetical protein
MQMQRREAKVSSRPEEDVQTKAGEFAGYGRGRSHREKGRGYANHLGGGLPNGGEGQAHTGPCREE